MKEDSIVKENLMTQKGYMPYCGSNIPRPPVGKGCDNPRTRFNGEQFVCPKCGWVSSFETEFIKKYKEKWLPVKEVLSTQRYTFEVTHFKDGTSDVKRENQGFSLLELMGIASLLSHHLMQLYEGFLKEPTKEEVKSTNSPFIHTPKKDAP